MEPRKKLSKSACEKYMQCPASFNYHYNEKIRPIRTDSPLVFGSGIDSALNAILLNEGDPLEEYRKAIATTEIGMMVPRKDDLEEDLLLEDMREQLLIQLRQYGYQGDDVLGLAAALFQRMKDKEPLSENQYKALDTICRASLEQKAILMFEAYEREIMPFIDKVHEVQSLAGPGVVDAVVDWRDVGTIILDNKTAKKWYPDNAVEYSHQLAMYAEEKGIRQVAFVVLGKKLVRNKVKTQVILGEVTDEMIKVSSELQREVQRAVDAKIFPCNVTQCNNQYGKPCTYRDLKWKGDMSGLEVKSKDKK